LQAYIPGLFLMHVEIPPPGIITVRRAWNNSFPAKKGKA
jgi:hypothetical protein